jgi:hypothetical protein
MGTPPNVAGPINVGNPAEFTIIELAQGMSRRLLK